MTDVTLTMVEVVSLPDGTVALESPMGTISGFRLPTGEVLKPWIVYELYTDAAGVEVCRDLTDAELEKLDVQVGLDYDRSVDGAIPIQQLDEESPADTQV